MHEYGLDQPVLVRYWNWLSGFFTGNMGTSTLYHRPVVEVLSQRIGPTLILSFTALLIAVIVSLPLGVMSAYKPYTVWDNLASVVTFFGSCMPGFMTCLIAISIFSVTLKWFPTQGMYTANSAHDFANLAYHLALPALVSSMHMMGRLIKQTRSAVLEVMNEEYIKTARSKGLKERKVVIGHALRNALIPIITQISLSVPGLVGGSVVIEQIFSWPGMGSMIIACINARDFDPVLAATVVICATVMVANLLLDFLYIALDPRVARER